MSRNFPLSNFGYPDVESEEPLNCPDCDGLYDARFWGQATPRFMDRNETYRWEVGLLCPECKTFFEINGLMKHQEEFEAELRAQANEEV